MAALEQEINHIRRDQDYRYFLENRDGIWHTSVIESERAARRRSRLWRHPRAATCWGRESRGRRRTRRR